jgi:hypothetical protein
VLLGAGVLAVTALCFVLWSRRPPPAAQIASAPPGASASPAAAPRPEPPVRKPASDTERARGGDLDAIKLLDSKPPAERTIDETLAISEGHAVLARDVEELDAICAEIRRCSGQDTLARLSGHARDPALAPIALPIGGAAGSARPGSALRRLEARESPCHAVARRGSARGEERARKASKALDLLDLEEETRCERLRSLLVKAREEADRRALPRLKQLAKKAGCGPKQKDDCYECLRGDQLLAATREAVRGRKPPRPWDFRRR